MSDDFGSLPPGIDPEMFSRAAEEWRRNPNRYAPAKRFRRAQGTPAGAMLASAADCAEIRLRLGVEIPQLLDMAVEADPLIERIELHDAEPVDLAAVTAQDARLHDFLLGLADAYGKAKVGLL